MLVQIALGTVVILLSTLAAGLGFLALERGLSASRRWLQSPPFYPKVLLLLMASVFWVLSLMTLSVWLWAAAYMALGLFATLESAIYFSIVSFTTLGFGDVLLEEDWRLLSGLEAMNGLLMFGLLTAMLVEALRRIRSFQVNNSPWS